MLSDMGKRQDEKVRRLLFLTMILEMVVGLGLWRAEFGGLMGPWYISYLALFPALYIALGVIEVMRHRRIRYYFLGLVPVIEVTVVTYIYDGTTTARTNPDSSAFSWMVFFSAVRLAILLGGTAVIALTGWLTRFLRSQGDAKSK